MASYERLTMREMWLDGARRSPRQTAIKCIGGRGDKSLTYSELVDRAQQLARALYQQGARHQDRISVLSKNSTELVEVYACCNISGYIAAPINWRLAGPEVAYILEDSTPKVLIFEEEFAPLIDSVREQASFISAFVCVGDNTPDWAIPYEAFLQEGASAKAGEEGEEEATFTASPDDIAHLLYTSGTTGKPKGVMRSQFAEVHGAGSFALAMQLNFGATTLAIMPLFHIGALAVLHAQIYCEGTVVLHTEFEPELVLKTIHEEKISTTHMAPTLINDVFNHSDYDKYDLSSLNTISYAAAPMPVSLLKEGIKRLGDIFIDCYGSTETYCMTYLYKHRHRNITDPDIAKRLGSVGQPTPGVKLRIVDDNGNTCPPHEVGEICIKSPTMMSGYWNNTFATLSAHRDGWYATGDVGYLDEEDYLFLVDRKKDMIISGGENVYCREVEEALMAEGSLHDVAVIGVPDERWGESVRAIIIRKPGSTATEEELIEFCRTKIARYKCPKSIIFVDEFPRLASGKVRKTELRELYGQ